MPFGDNLVVNVLLRIVIDIAYKLAPTSSITVSAENDTFSGALQKYLVIFALIRTFWADNLGITSCTRLATIDQSTFNNSAM